MRESPCKNILDYESAKIPILNTCQRLKKDHFVEAIMMNEIMSDNLDKNHSHEQQHLLVC